MRGTGNLRELLGIGVPHAFFLDVLERRHSLTFAEKLSLTLDEDDDPASPDFAESWARRFTAIVESLPPAPLSGLSFYSILVEGLTDPDEDRPTWMTELTDLPIELLVLLQGRMFGGPRHDVFAHEPYRRIFTAAVDRVAALPDTDEYLVDLRGRTRLQAINGLASTAAAYPSLRDERDRLHALVAEARMTWGRVR